MHHRHLPWRIYLAPLPIACLIAVWLALPAQSFWRVGRGWAALFLVCLAPTGATLRQVARRLAIDVRAKWAWLRRQPRRLALARGALAGGTSGILLGTAPVWDKFVSDVNGLFVLALVFALPLLVTLLPFPRRNPALEAPVPPLVAAFVALCFVPAYTANYLLWWPVTRDWFLTVGFFTAVHAVTAIAVAVACQRLQARRPPVAAHGQQGEVT